MLAAFLLLLTAMSTTASAADTPYNVQFSGQNWLGLNQTTTITVNVTGGPPGNFNYSASLVGSTSSLGKVSPTYGSSSGKFTLNVTAPSSAQDIILVVNVTSGGTTGSGKYTIKVIDPLVISATVTNLGNMTVSDVPLQFYVDDQLLNSTTFTISGKSNKTVSYDWYNPSLATGSHKVTIKIDPNNEFVKFASGGSEYTTSIYVGDSGAATLNLILAVILGVLLFFAFITYMNRGKKKRRR